MTGRVYLYGLGGPDTSYAVIKYMYIEREQLSVRHMVSDALWLQMKNPTIEHVYAIDDREWLAWDYRDAIRLKSVESFAAFKSILERERVCWLSKLGEGSHMRLFSFIYAGVAEWQTQRT